MKQKYNFREGGALLINNPEYALRAEILREKGTNRTSFYRGETSKYTWVDLGSSYLPGEITAAFLYAQLSHATDITVRRMQIWDYYHKHLEDICSTRGIAQPIIPINLKQNGHIYHLVFPEAQQRDNFIAEMKRLQVHCVFHYVPLHDSPAGLQYSRISGDLSLTSRLSSSLVRLPMYLDVDIPKVVCSVKLALSS